MLPFVCRMVYERLFILSQGYCNDSLVCHVNFKDDSTEEFPFSTSSVRFFDSNLDLFPRAANDYPPCTTFYNTSVHETEVR